MTDTPPPHPHHRGPGHALRHFFGILLMLIGGIIALATGLCVWILGSNSIAGPHADSMSQLWGAIGVGAVPFLIGVALIVGGWFVTGFRWRGGGK